MRGLSAAPGDPALFFRINGSKSVAARTATAVALRAALIFLALLHVLPAFLRAVASSARPRRNCVLWPCAMQLAFIGITTFMMARRLPMVMGGR